MRSALVVAWAAIGMAAVSGTAVAQSLPTPGAPSQPFSSVAQMQNGGNGPQVTYQYGIEFVTVNGSPVGVDSSYPNFAIDGSAGVPRGGLAYDYRISRYEVSAGSMAAFYTAVAQVGSQTGQPIPYITSGGLNGGGQYGRAGNISWRTAAIYCNWLSNGQALTREAFMNGAYDVSTFGLVGNQYTDQLTHNPGAQFWIPTLDEWIRAANYDPNRNGPEQGGWWQYSISRDTNAIPGLPRWGGEANAGFSTPNLEEFTVPLGAYHDIQSPWGLFDAVGQSAEWLEDPWYQTGPGLPSARMLAGAYITGAPADVAFGSMQNGDAIGVANPLDAAYWMGFRIAAAVPAPAVAPAFGMFALVAARRRRA